LHAFPKHQAVAGKLLACAEANEEADMGRLLVHSKDLRGRNINYRHYRILFVFGSDFIGSIKQILLDRKS